jgi:hypothetical protein
MGEIFSKHVKQMEGVSLLINKILVVGDDPDQR